MIHSICFLRGLIPHCKRPFINSGFTSTRSVQRCALRKNMVSSNSRIVGTSEIGIKHILADERITQYSQGKGSSRILYQSLLAAGPLRFLPCFILPLSLLLSAWGAAYGHLAVQFWSAATILKVKLYIYMHAELLYLLSSF